LNALAIENAYLPCSATWASRFWHIEPAPERPYLFLVPSTGSFARDASGRRPHGKRAKALALAAQWAPIYAALRAEGYEVKVLCHEIGEYEALRTSVPANDVWYHGDAFTLLREYAFAHTVVSARLHASLPAFGIPGTRVLHLCVDVRGSAVEILPKIGRLHVASQTPETIAQAVRKLEPSEPSDLAPWEAAYVDFIRSHVPPLSL